MAAIRRFLPVKNPNEVFLNDCYTSQSSHWTRQKKPAAAGLLDANLITDVVTVSSSITPEIPGAVMPVQATLEQAATKLFR